jgi:hypothetical protein
MDYNFNFDYLVKPDNLIHLRVALVDLIQKYDDIIKDGKDFGGCMSSLKREYEKLLEETDYTKLKSVHKV